MPKACEICGGHILPSKKSSRSSRKYCDRCSDIFPSARQLATKEFAEAIRNRSIQITKLWIADSKQESSLQSTGAPR